MAIADFVKKIVQTAHFFKLKNLKKEKTHYEFAYWEERKKAEGILGNQHYEYFYTLHFNLNAISYNRKSILDIGCGPRGSLEWANMASI
ncbi:MAG: hypothetical protein GTO02_13850, partial [Candidatus Dadabacteria bacterium]|nr:hypothetical protein [Candidatus Dadabacteria bacterium]